MAEKQHRKYLVTIQNPNEKGFTRDVIKDILASMNVSYYCISDEIAPTTGTPHTHIFMYRKGAIRESTIRRKFPAVHYDYCIGTCAQNRDYVAKQGKWSDDKKGDSIVPGSFEENGDLPDERQEKAPEMSDIISDVMSGKTTAEIIKDNPKLLFRTNAIDTLRETLTADEFLMMERDITVTYCFGPTGAGKTRSIYDAHDIRDICRITNYGTSNNGVRFDGYHNHSVLVFEEFMSQIPITDMLCYLDRYPISLPARYSDRIACYKKIYITSNVSLNKQYMYEQQFKPEVWRAFLRRITNVVEFLKDGTRIQHDKEEFI